MPIERWTNEMLGLLAKSIKQLRDESRELRRESKNLRDESQELRKEARELRDEYRLNMRFNPYQQSSQQVFGLA